MPATTVRRGLTPQLALTLIVAVLIGGGGVAYGLANLSVQLTALALLAVNREAFASFWCSSALPLRILTATTLALPALHLIPMPPSIWSALPGRELAVEARSALGPLQWHPISLDSGRSLVSILGLIVPMTLLIIGLAASSRALIRAGWCLVALGLVTFAIGIPQVLYPSSQSLLFPENHMEGVLFGTFANRNSTGLFLVACLILLLHLPPTGPIKHIKFARLLAGLLIVLAVILTQSRSAMTLVLIPLVGGIIRWVPVKLFKVELRGRGVAIAVIVLLGVIAATITVAPGSRLETSVERFSQGNEARQHIWDDATYSAEKYWPVGSGMGTFDEVFQADESIENLSPKTAGRAHNDYLELAIEAGLAGLLLIASWGLLTCWAAWQARRLPDPWLPWSGGLILLAISVQSIVDYPLRSQAMLALAGYALALIFSAIRGGSKSPT